MDDITASQTEQTAQAILDEKQAQSRKDKLTLGWALFILCNYFMIIKIVPLLVQKDVPTKEMLVQVFLLSISAPGYFTGKMKHRVWVHIVLSVAIAGFCAMMDLMQ